MNNQIELMAQNAERAAMQGNWALAEQLWSEVATKDNSHPRAFHRLGIHAFQKRDYKLAIKHLERAIQIVPNDPFIRLMLANAERENGNKIGEIEVLDACLALDPYFYPALLQKGVWQEKYANRSIAAETYRNTLIIAPPETHWPPELRPQLEHARKFSQEFNNSIETYLIKQVGSKVKLENKWAEAISIMSGKTKPYHSTCNQLHVPRIAETTFFDRSHFPWIEGIESKTDEIKHELENALATIESSFSAYIGYKPGEPVNQWAELNHSRRWKTLALWKGGERQEDILSLCPNTEKALSQVEMADIDGLCPNAMFSALAPHTEIPPHNGETNARLVVHLPLIVPANCRFKVGFDEIEWEVGKIIAFDDSLLHSARNDSNELRVVLIFDTWNPYLTNDDREMVRILTKARREFS